MRTRTLLLLAVATGLAILVAGGVQLVRVSSQDETVPSSELGDVVGVADMEVVVREVSLADQLLRVDVSLGGVDDPDGADGFALVVPNSGLAVPEPAGGDARACGATTPELRACTLTFDVSGSDGDVRTLRYERGDERARWLLPDVGEQPVLGGG